MPSRRRFILTTTGALALAGTRAWSQPAGSALPTFDYIVVGGGSSGCVVASRLSERGDVRVLLLEAGERASDPAVSTPGKWTTLLGGRWDWSYATEAERHLGGRCVPWPRGKGLGGSSLINAMVYVRGHRLDYDHWNYLGNAGWDHASVLPYFLRSEDNERGESAFHGAGGPLRVSDTPDPTDAHLAFLDAARELGHEADAEWDFNGARQENGAGFYQKHIAAGARQSVADAFLAGTAAARPNLAVETSARATRVLLDGSRATGVEFVARGEVRRARAVREVIVSTGVVESPKLLMLSGIGPADALRRHGIPVAADLPGVGENLQDHLKVTVAYRALRQIPASTVSAGLFLRSRDGLGAAAPDLQFYFGRGLDTPSQALGLTVALERPHSRGIVSLRSRDPGAPPAIEARYLESSADVAALVEGVRILRGLAETRAFAPWRGEPLDPGPSVSSRDTLEAFVRRAADTIFHPAGTCRMGHDRLAVVDHELRVHGVEGLRVADASIMPTVVNGNTNAACVMIGERVATFAAGA